MAHPQSQFLSCLPIMEQDWHQLFRCPKVKQKNNVQSALSLVVLMHSSELPCLALRSTSRMFRKSSVKSIVMSDHVQRSMVPSLFHLLLLPNFASVAMLIDRCSNERASAKSQNWTSHGSGSHALMLGMVTSQAPQTLPYPLHSVPDP